MKKTFILALMLPMFSIAAFAQNLQFHYDFGKTISSEKEAGRQDVTVTYEKFSADKLGSWFYFVDLDLDKNGVMGAYTEISREFNIGKQGFAAHVEYDGGMNRLGSFQTAGLAGIAWNGHNADFSTTYSIQAMYKQFFKQYNNIDGYASFQLTGVWSTAFLDGKLTFAGFADIWLGKNSKSNGGVKELTDCLVFLAEPQLWYNISPKISVGTEVELSNNFIYRATDGNNRGFFVNPTLAVKFNL